MKELSIVVPVYNTAQYLARCVDSLLAVEGIDYEILLVDDGSTDSSGEICDSYGKRHGHVHAIHQENRGLVAARDRGLREACGCCIAFVDSDDWIDAKLYGRMVGHLKSHPETDICIAGTKRNADDGFEAVLLDGNDELMDSAEAIKRMVHRRGFHWYLWGKVYRRELFQGMEMDSRVTIYEDLDRNWILFRRARKVCFCSGAYYHYFCNPEGITERRCDVNLASWQVFRRALRDGAEEVGVGKAMIDYCVQVFMRQAMEMCFVSAERNREDIESLQAGLRAALEESKFRPSFLSPDDLQRITESWQSCVEYFQSVFRRIREALRRACRHGTFYVYGTGIVAQYVASIMEQEKIECAAYLVSDGQMRRRGFHGREVRFLSELGDAVQDSPIVLALSGKARGAVEGLLRGQGCRNVIPAEFPPIIF